MSGMEGLGMVMLVLMIGVIFVGFPISFTLLIIALAFGYIGLGQMVFDLAYLQIIGLMKMEELAAVPLFIFMGFLTEQAGLMERLFRAFRDLLASVRGALYLGVILTATVFAMATGIVGAAVTVLGIMAAPIMIKSGYDARMSAGAIAAGGTLGILIPPSVMLIVMGPVLGVSVADLYSAAFGPGFMLAGMYIIYTMTRSFLNPKLGPPVPIDERPESWFIVIREVLLGMVPLGMLITCTLGSILMGIATPTEAASVGCFGAFVLAVAYGRFTFRGVKAACISTMNTTSMVMFLAAASNIFGAVFARLGTAEWITKTLIALPLPPTAMLLLVLGLIFLLGWPFEWPAIILVFLPIFQPVIQALGYDMIWFGALVAVTMQTAYLSPPVAMSAYYLKQVVPQWSLGTIYKGMFDFMGIQVIAILIVAFVPAISLWLPTTLTAQAKAERMAPSSAEDAATEKEQNQKNMLEDDYKPEDKVEGEAPAKDSLDEEYKGDKIPEQGAGKK
ncbi:MAG: TRAP transporter large permease subunit [Proteobacteria bacterium]|nr:TRAP transporter large permease subunit [Pseudomonadota bacterium]